MPKIVHLIKRYLNRYDENEFVLSNIRLIEENPTIQDLIKMKSNIITKNDIYYVSRIKNVIPASGTSVPLTTELKNNDYIYAYIDRQ